MVRSQKSQNEAQAAAQQAVQVHFILRMITCNCHAPCIHLGCCKGPHHQQISLGPAIATRGESVQLQHAVGAITLICEAVAICAGQ